MIGSPGEDQAFSRFPPLNPYAPLFCSFNFPPTHPPRTGWGKKANTLLLFHGTEINPNKYSPLQPVPRPGSFLSQQQQQKIKNQNKTRLNLPSGRGRAEPYAAARAERVGPRARDASNPAASRLCPGPQKKTRKRLWSGDTQVPSPLHEGRKPGKRRVCRAAPSARRTGSKTGDSDSDCRARRGPGGHGGVSFAG